MADKSGSNDEENPNLRRRRDSEEDDGAYQDGASSSSGARRPDLGLGHAQKRRGRGSRDEGTPEMPRREDSGSLSFKHFLQAPGSSSGARPKVYDNPRSSYDQSSPPFRRPATGPPAELASALPDFVQDHLVMEQCYLQNNIDLDNLPDFAAMDLGQRGGSLPFDLTARNGEPSNNNGSLPLDLAPPSGAERPMRGPAEHVPCDLGLGNNLVQQSPLDLRGGEMNLQDNSVNQSLPDFLSDGPILSGRETEGQESNMDDSDRSGMTDNERLLRRQLTEATRRSDQLEMELQRQQEVIRHKEEILRRTNSELAALRRENANLRQGFGGGHPDHRAQRVAQNLLTAATNAESSIRTLLQGVEDLRNLASTLDQAGPSGQHLSPPRQSPHHEFDPEDRAGPAL